jgi:Zn-dependent membrane protease YugP
MSPTFYYIIIGLVSFASYAVSSRLKKKFKYYSGLRLSNGLSGKEIAEKMLRDHGISDVQVISVPGQLTDHYNPRNKTVNLSEVVYNERNAAAAAVAAHEVGHAVQHAEAYSWLQLRSQLVPIVSISSRFSTLIIIAGIVMSAATSLGFGVAVVGLVLMATATLFSFITLPVEYDASNRALDWLNRTHMLSNDEYAGAEDSLKWAARTYLVAALGSLAMLFYWALTLLGSRD